MPKILCVGDLHLKKNQLEETKPLLEKIIRLSYEHDKTILMGDLHDEHGIIRADVLTESDKFLRALKPGSINLEGNHDVLADQTASSLTTLGGVQIVNEYIMSKIGGHLVAFIPFIRDNKKFEECLIEFAKNPTAKYVFCHQDFNGAQYANGYYSPHGVNPQILADLGLQVISGHIHQPQSFGNVFYTGSPRWINRGDANQRRGLWSIDLDTFQTAFISSEDVSPVCRTIEIDDSTVLEAYPAKDKIVVVYNGSSDQKISEIRAKYANVSIQKIAKVMKPVQISEKSSLKDAVVDFTTKRLNKNQADLVLQEIFKRIQL